MVLNAIIPSMAELLASCERGPQIYKNHEVIWYDIDGTLLEIYPRALALASFKLPEENREKIKFGEAWEVVVFDQIKRLALMYGLVDEVNELYKSGFWIDESLYKLLPATLGSREFVEWNLDNGKTQKVHSSRDPKLLRVTKESIKGVFPEITEMVLRDSNDESVNEYLLKIGNAERDKAIFIDDKPELAEAYVDVIDALFECGRVPSSHLILVPYAQLRVLSNVLDPKYSEYITVFENMDTGLKKPQDLGRILAYFQGRKGAHSQVVNI